MSALNAEEHPAQDLPPIVGTADPLEAPAFRNTSGVGPRLPQVSQSDMSHQVTVLKENEKGCDGEHELLAASPAGWTVVGMQEEIHVDEAKDEPVVEAILEQVEDGHRVV